MKKLLIKSIILFLCLGAISCGPSRMKSAGTIRRVVSDIIGGDAVQEGQYSEVVGIQAGGSIFCSGVLIAPQWVLTAAHCLNLFPADSILVSTGNSIANATHYQIEELHIHPQFFPGRFGFKTTRAAADLGLIKLKEAISNVIPASLVPGPQSFLSLEQEKVLVIGFGAREGKQGTSLTGEKYQVEVLRDFFTAGEMLFGNEDPRQGGCHGDSGGPLFQYHPQLRRHFLTGITSRQLIPFVPCTESIGVATEIGFFLPWIQSVVSDVLVDEKVRAKEAKSLIKSHARTAGMGGALNLRNLYGLQASDFKYLNSTKIPSQLKIDLMGTGIRSLKEIDLAEHSWSIDPLFLDSESRQELIKSAPIKNVSLPEGLLIEAMFRQDSELTALALKDDAQIIAIDSYGNSTLLWAVANNDLELVDLFLARGISPATVNDEKISPLMIASSPAIQNKLLQFATDEDLRLISKKGWSLLHFAIDRADINFLKILLERGVPANLAGVSADLPFEFALMRGQEEMAMLIEQYL